MKGLHRLLLDTVANVELVDPRIAQEVSRSLTFFFRDRVNSTLQSPPATIPSLLTRALPDDLHLLSAQQWPLEGEQPRRQVLIRLQHIGSPKVGQIALELSDLFTLGRVVRATEMSLTANQLADEAKKNNLIWPQKSECCRTTADYGNGTRVVIKPAEIKTFILELA